MQNTSSTVNLDNEKLRRVVRALESYERQKKELAEEIKDLYQEAKSEGFDVKAIRKVVSAIISGDDPYDNLEEGLLAYKQYLQIVQGGTFRTASNSSTSTDHNNFE